MKIFLLVSTLTAASAEEMQAPWTSLFDGTDLSAWSIEASPADEDKDFITLDNGTIWAHATAPDMIPKNHVWLLTRKEYSDFILTLKFQSVRGDTGNSGIQFRSRLDETGTMQGPQLDLHPAGPWRTGMLYDMTTGVNRFLAPDLPIKDVKEHLAAPGFIFHFSDDKPAWNEMEITAIGPHIKCVLNGVTVIDFHDEKDVLKDAFHRKYDVGTTGYIGLQIHGGTPSDLRFKDIRIKDLSAP
ncbi:MAG: DUF1080 domain-containing protein [Luteolibacter sp.]